MSEDAAAYKPVRIPKLARCEVVSKYASVACQKPEGHQGFHRADVLGTEFTWTVAESER